ncbi:phosphotidylinositol kinase [Cordyceps militaris]|uniref:Serine/threonine-protein kinase Tel1 n=1 Tax=Cordyceps militaris TaxID=73501 RepID=A0A2H4SW41_CORMI|nr:phosphotidylinositol kinase [Cordyceps militaris]
MSSAYTQANRINVADLAAGAVKTRDKALDDLNQLLSRNNGAVDLSELGDKAYHDIFEALFKTVLEQKPKYFDKKTSKPAELRLNKCARAVRAAASRGASKLKLKTLSAVIDHITQVLPGPSDGFVRPLLNDYVKALTELLSRAANVEYFSRNGGQLWQICADFFLDVISNRIPQNGTIDLGLIGRNSPAPSTPRSTLRSNSGSLLSQKPPEIADGEPARDALEGLLCLVAAPNAHILSRSQDMANAALRVLRLHNLSLGSLQTMSFAIINVVLSATQLDNPTYTGSLVQDLLPLMAHWWRADRVSQDDTIKSLRNEILRTILLSQLHIEKLAVNKWNDGVREDIVYLLEPLWQEYSKRSPGNQLKLGDITFATDTLPKDYLQIGIFGLNPLNTEAESQWGIIQCIASLEAILGRPKPQAISSQRTEQPRKRRRVDQSNSRLRARLKDRRREIVQTALQAIPFILTTGALNADEVQDLLLELVSLTTHKDTSIASWALIACSSCLQLSNATAKMIDDWKQLWQVATRAISLQSTCRAACLLIHSLLETEVLPHHSLSGDINSITTTADVNGPAVLCDTSIALMNHLLYVRNTILPSASQATSNHIIRWALRLWNPADSSASSPQSQSLRPINLVNILRSCCGMKPVIGNKQDSVIGGGFCETWKLQNDIGQFNEYLLLLDHESEVFCRVTCGYHPSIETTGTPSDSNTHFPSKKLLLELLFPKFEELSALCTSWSKKPNEGGSQISQGKFESLLSACIVGAMLLPEISYLNSSQSALIEGLIMSNAERGITHALASVDANSFIQQLLRNIEPCIPDLTSAGMDRLHGENEALLRLLTLAFDMLSKHDMPKDPTGSYDMMELDDEFESQSSRAMNLTTSISLPRFIHQVCLSPVCFYIDTRCRLCFVVSSQREESQVGLVSSAFIDEVVRMSDEELLSCYSLLTELFSSDLVVDSDGALAILQRLGQLVGSSDFRCCEVALTTCVEVMHGLCSMWLNDSGELSNSVGDLYHYFTQTCLEAKSFSPRSLKALSAFLFTLLRLQPGYGTSLKLDSCRTSLLFILREGTMDVKYFVAERIAELFELYILMLHDEVFVDVLASLPTDPESEAGIACRLLVLSNLAQRWPTLLRRCTYHIFETPGKISSVSEHARRCIADISRSLNLESPKELFGLFTRQLLYTWMENDSVDDIPFAIFGFDSLGELLTSSQSDAIGLSTMRGQSSVRSDIARHIGRTEAELLQTNFAASISYSTVYTAAFEPSSKDNGEAKIKKKMGTSTFMESIYTNFVDIVAFFFDIIDQEDAVEKVFARSEELVYAAKTYKDITRIAHSDTKLPPNQQPMFRAKYVIHELARLCQGTEFLFKELWTSALVVSIARKLFNTVHPALGSLHACSVLRKVRVLICLAGPVALESYCLEMLLNSVRTFITDSECADDALGISQYLLEKGTPYLEQTPSFLAGYSLSALASLRVFLESSQSSTTQESQFKATMSKAKRFHEWLSAYLDSYTSLAFKNESQKLSFKSITNSAARIRSSGNAEQSTFESKLLLDILRDGNAEHELLNDPSRELAMGLLCGDFTIPDQASNDVLGTDADAILHASAVWKSCNTKELSANYLAWAGRVVGKAFAASGDIPEGIVAESDVATLRKVASGPNGSEMGLLSLLQSLTSNSDTLTAGLAESVLRAAISAAVQQEDEPLLIACQRTLAEPLYHTSQWCLYHSPPSENVQSKPSQDSQSIWDSDVTSEKWLSDLSILMANSVPDSILLSVLSPVLAKVKGFAEKAFPFIVHLVLLFQLEQQQVMKRSISAALRTWLQPGVDSARPRIALLINTLLYLRTQQYPKEGSINDRLHWLDVDYSMAATAATQCGMYKTALLFAELASIETGRQSRRASAARESDLSATLLSIFENIDDPDAYYGLAEEATLSNVLSRITFENDGMKSVAFLGAQFDNDIRLQNGSSTVDVQALVSALSSLGQSGLSYSLQQMYQAVDTSSASTENTFKAAQRLEMWNLPAPKDSDSFAVTTYKAYQAIHNATEMASVRSVVHEGFAKTIRSAMGNNRPTRSILRNKLGTLAALSELDDLMNVSRGEDLSNVLGAFQSRGDWMKRGRYDDVSNILSCRSTTMSMLSQHSNILQEASLSTSVMRKAEVESLLLSSGLYRFHEATQESLNIATSLSNLIPTCRDLDLHVDASVNIEVANSLWDQGEMSTAIQMLQAIDADSALSRQAIPVTKADLLAKIGDRLSIARREKPRDIQKKYLEPALKEIGSTNYGTEAGLVFHQFALFCDGQLQDADGLEDLERLQSLRKAKSDEVSELKELIASTKESQLRKRYDYVLSKEKQWLELDEQELRRVEQTRSEFVRLSVENYLLSLIASDAHNNDALRFTALWLERSGEEGTNKAVSRYLSKVPTRKFASLMNQLTSRLQYTDSAFQKLLLELVYNICVDHPYHGMYQIWSGTKVRVQSKDEVAVQRVKAAEKVAQRLATTKPVASTWLSIEKTSKYYHGLAVDRDANKYKAGAKFTLKETQAGLNLVIGLAKYHIPPPTMHVEIQSNKDYSTVPKIAKLEPTMTIAGGVSAPKIITAIGTDGKKYKQLVKGGHDDLRQDAIMEQVFAAVSSLLKHHRSAQQRNLGIRTYKVLPLTATSGLIEFVPNTIPLHEFLMPAHERYYPKDLKGSQCRKEIFSVQNRNIDTRISTYRKVTDRFHPVMKYFFMEYFEDPDEWYAKRLAYTRTTAAISMLGHVLGLGDRHGHNILLDTKTGEVVHIDLGVAFEAGRILPVPELVPFRLTRDIIDGMGISKTEGVFRRCCEFTLDALREEQYSIMTILDVLRYDPLYTWSISPLRLAKLQKARDQDENVPPGEDADGVHQADKLDKQDKKNRKVGKKNVNEPSEADRALEVVRKKLSKALSTTATVNDLINQATDERNLAVLYSGWAAYA